MIATAPSRRPADDLPPLAAEVRQVQGFIERTLRRHRAVSAECRLFAVGGKLLRTHLVFASLSPSSPRRHGIDAVQAAAAVELVHAASLLHDDIVDRSATRRGLPALHRLHGHRAAACSGMYLVHLALTLIARLPARVRIRMADTAHRVARGQFIEVARAHDPSLSPADRLAIMREKTASLFAMACELGGLLGGDEAGACRRKRSLGEAFGMLFQLADDIDDMLAPEAELGRAPGADLLAGVISLPMAFALESPHRSALLPLLEGTRSLTDADRVRRCALLLGTSGALARTCETAMVHLARARRHLERVSRCCEAAWIGMLLDDTMARITRRVAPRRA